jgi:hypothetical protein
MVTAKWQSEFPRTKTHRKGNRSSVLPFLGFHNKMSQTRWLKQQKSVLSQLWMWEIQDQGVPGLVSSEALAYRWSFFPWILTWLFLYTHPDFSSSYRNHFYWIRAPSLWLCLFLTASLKALSTNIFTLETRDPKANMADTIQPKTVTLFLLFLRL